MEYDAELKNAEWRQNDSGGRYLVGNIYNDSRKRFDDGEYIHTSTVMKDDGEYITTRNTVYKVSFNELWVSETCKGQSCAFKSCNAPAYAKVCESVAPDDPFKVRHELSSYVCAYHFRDLFGGLGMDWVNKFREGVMKNGKED